VDGEFARPDFAKLGIEPAELAWDHAQLVVGVSDVRAIQQESSLSWNGKPIAFLPGTGDFPDAPPGSTRRSRSRDPISGSHSRSRSR